MMKPYRTAGLWLLFSMCCTPAIVSAIPAVTVNSPAARSAAERYLAQAHGPWAARGNFLWWLARAGIATLVLAPASLVRPSLRPRLWHEWGRVRYCLTHLGWPFLCCSFGRNDAPRRETKG